MDAISTTATNDRRIATIRLPASGPGPGIDRETKLVPSWYVGDRSSTSAIIVMDDLRSRLALVASN